MTAETERFGEECPRCLTWAGDDVSVCESCGYPIPMALVLPYDDPPWEYTPELVNLFRPYEALRLMASYRGKSPERIGELERCRRLYLSRCKGFQFRFLSPLARLEYLELDYAPIADVDGAPELGLAILKLTECRQLQRIDALAECKTVKLLSLALSNAVRDHSPIGGMAALQSLFIESRELESLEFVRQLPELRSIALGVDRINLGGIEPVFDLDGLEHIALRKKLTKPGDVQRIRERWPDAELVVD